MPPLHQDSDALELHIPRSCRTMEHMKETKENAEILMYFHFSIVGLSVPALTDFVIFWGTVDKL